MFNAMHLYNFRNLLRALLFSAIQVFLLSILFTAVSIIFMYFWFGTLKAGRAWISGETVIVDEAMYESTYESGQKFAGLTYLLRNLSAYSIPIIGSSASCSCALIGDIPSSIPPFGVVNLNGLVKLDRKSGRDISGTLVIYVGRNIRSEIPLTYTLKPEDRKER
jgi:hypothetical protein